MRASALDLRGKRVLVVGLGIHGGGVGVARFLSGQGAQVTVSDLKPAEELAASLEALKGLPIRFVLGEHRLEDLDSADMLIRNPAVPAESPFLAAARQRGIAIEMEMSLFFRLCPGPILAVTGTKGKTTTTLLLASILQQVEARTVAAGNMRISALELLPSLTPTTPACLELSSWQLEGLEPYRLSPHIGVITNITPDHLNRYSSFEAYAQAKGTMVRWQTADDVAVLNRDDQTVARFVGEGRARTIWFSRRQPVDGVYLDGADVVLDWQGRRSVLCQRGDVRLPGEHSIENVLAAAAAAVAWGAPPETIRTGIRGFAGVEHRLEFVRELDGVRYINDTTATAPAAALAALQAFPEPLIVIAGGADKRLEFGELGQALARRAKRIVLLDGTATGKLAAAIERSGGEIAGRFSVMTSAVQEAQRLAERGDVVLLSPGCASFGLFANEFERGDTFRQAVGALQPTQRHPAV